MAANRDFAAADAASWEACMLRWICFSTASFMNSAWRAMRRSHQLSFWSGPLWEQVISPPALEEQALQMFPSSPMATAWDISHVLPGMMASFRATSKANQVSIFAKISWA